MREAEFYFSRRNGSIQCLLCPHTCIIDSGERGFCRVRENREGKLYTLVYGKVSALAVDPIEKKPLFHFYPGSSTFSISTASCNFRCKFCQNYHLSQVDPEEIRLLNYSPKDIVNLALKYECPSISYTYNEPLIWYEFIIETARLAREKGIMNVLVTNGYINLKPLKKLAQFIDAANVDLKAFKDKFYQDLCEVKSVKPVLRTVEKMKKMGVHVEVTNLIIPGYNDNLDDIRMLCMWVRDKLGEDTPVHFSRFYPHYKMLYVSPTPTKTLEAAWNIAREVGLNYPYIGNLPGHKGEHTYCPNCDKPVIERIGFDLLKVKVRDGKCEYCGAKINIIGDIEERGSRLLDIF